MLRPCPAPELHGCTALRMQPCNPLPDRPVLISGGDADLAHWPPWTEAEFRRLLDRAAALRNFGFSATDADDLAERLLREDRRAGQLPAEIR